MPELPEVETVAADLREAGLAGRMIVRAEVGWPRTVATHAPGAFDRALRGRRIASIGRRAKYLLLVLDEGGTLVVHLRMTGRLHFRTMDAPREVHEHVVLRLDDGRELRFHDTRKFGRWSLVPDAAAMLAHLGPEPLAASFTGQVFARHIARRRGMLKPLLLDQTFLAGLGNIYVDEALFAARLHPQRRAETLTDDDVARLYRAIRRVLRIGVQSLGTSLGEGRTNFYSVAGRRGRNQDRLKVFRRTGLPCPVCRTPITRLVVGQRSTHLCPSCQPEPA